jgi:hypothetical protein
LRQTASRNSTGNFRHGNELQIEQSGLLGEPLHPLLAVSWFVGWHSFVDVFRAELNHSVNQSGQLVRHRGDRFGSTEPGS